MRPPPGEDNASSNSPFGCHDALIRTISHQKEAKDSHLQLHAVHRLFLYSYLDDFSNNGSPESGMLRGRELAIATDREPSVQQEAALGKSGLEPLVGRGDSVLSKEGPHL